MGRSEVLYGVLEHLLAIGHEITSIVSPIETPEYTRASEDFRGFAARMGIPFSPEVKMGELASFLAEGSPEIGVSVNYPVVITSGVIDSFRHGILNVHGGDLPRYKGNACQAWAILNGEEKIGLCVHKMEGGRLDSGDIISRDYFPIDLSSRIGDVHNWIAERAPFLVEEAIERLTVDSSFVLERQVESANISFRCYPRRPEDGRLDWGKSSLEALRLIKASGRPYAGAFTSLDGKMVTIWDAELVSKWREYMAVPGQVLDSSDNGLLVACGDGIIKITEMESRETVRQRISLRKSVRQRFI